MLTVEDGAVCDFCVDCKAETNRLFHSALIEDRQAAGERQIDRAGMCVRFCAERGGSAGENLRFC